MWRKATRTTDNGGNCVEVATGGTEIYVRDSKRPDDGHLSVDREAFRSFVEWIKAQ